MDNNEQTQREVQLEVSEGKKPKENAGFYFSSSLKITDPNTKEVLVQMRGDN